jgi:hypothetical protein
MTSLVLKNPEPVMVSVTALEPAGALFGLSDAMAGVGVVLPPPEPELLPAHPPTSARTPSEKNKAKKRTEWSERLRDAERITEGVPSEHMRMIEGYTTIYHRCIFVVVFLSSRKLLQ